MLIYVHKQNKVKGRRGAVGCTSDSNCRGRGFGLITGPRCFLAQETLPVLLSTGWFQERIRFDRDFTVEPK